MKVDDVIIVARKELQELMMNKGALISVMVFGMLFIITNLGAVTASASGGKASVDWAVIYLSLFIGVFAGFTLCGTVFFREKQSGVIETLMCSPLNLRTIWLGKVLGVAIPSYLLGLLSASLLTAFSYYAIGGVVTPSLLVLLHLLVVAPVFITSAMGLVGYVQLAMGMKENRFISMGVFILLIMGLSLSSGIVQEDAGMIGQVVIALLIGAAILFLTSFTLSKRLDKEKIVTSIPD